MTTKPLLADQAMHKLVREYEFSTVLDIGSGDGIHSDYFTAAGKRVTGIDYRPRRPGVIEANYLTHQFSEPFDCIWASHVLEHQPNAQVFLHKIYQDLKPGGVLAITVPPLKHEVVGGHVTLWNAGVLLYNLIVAGFDCSQARCKQYGYNISLITPKIAADLPTEKMRFANGDIELLSRFFPSNPAVTWQQGCSGDIAELNWEANRAVFRKRNRRSLWDCLRNRRAA